MTTETAALTQARRDYLRLDSRAGDLRRLLSTMGGSAELNAYSADLTLRARAAYATYRAFGAA